MLRSGGVVVCVGPPSPRTLKAGKNAVVSPAG